MQDRMPARRKYYQTAAAADLMPAACSTLLCALAPLAAGMATLPHAACYVNHHVCCRGLPA